MDWIVLPNNWSAAEFAARAGLFSGVSVLMLWSLLASRRDVLWVHEINQKYAEDQKVYVKKIKSEKTASAKKMLIHEFVAERIDATRARSARLVLLGFAIPSALLLLLLSASSWLFPESCAFPKGDCQPSLQNALSFVGWNFLRGVGIEFIFDALNWSLPTVMKTEKYTALDVFSYVGRIQAFTYMSALAYFEFRIFQFRRANEQKLAQLDEIAGTKTAATSVTALNETDEELPEQMAA